MWEIFLGATLGWWYIATLARQGGNTDLDSCICILESIIWNFDKCISLELFKCEKFWEVPLWSDDILPYKQGRGRIQMCILYLHLYFFGSISSEVLNFEKFWLVQLWVGDILPSKQGKERIQRCIFVLVFVFFSSVFFLNKSWNFRIARNFGRRNSGLVIYCHPTSKAEREYRHVFSYLYCIFLLWSFFCSFELWEILGGATLCWWYIAILARQRENTDVYWVCTEVQDGKKGNSFLSSFHFFWKTILLSLEYNCLSVFCVFLSQEKTPRLQFFVCFENFHSPNTLPLPWLGVGNIHFS